MDTSNVSESSSDTNSYPYKNEVSLSIGDDQSTVPPTPSPRQNFVAPMEDVPLTNDSPMVEKRNGVDNPAYEPEPMRRPLSSFGKNGHTNGLNDTQLGVKSPQNGKDQKQLAGKLA